MSKTLVNLHQIRGAPVSVLDYGADPSASAAVNTAAIAAAYAYAKSINGCLVFPAGNYKFTNLTFDGASTIVKGIGKVTLTCEGTSGAAITIGNMAGMEYFVMKDFHIVGNALCSPGIQVGINTGYSSIVLARFILENLSVVGFSKASAIGAYFIYAIEGMIRGCTFESCGGFGIGVQAWATTLNFDTCNFRTSTTCGAYTETGCIGILFTNCVFESNYGPGVYIHGGTNIYFKNCWWENNNRTASGTAKFNYSVCGDLGTDGIHSFKDCWMTGGAGTVGDFYFYNMGDVELDGITTYIDAAQYFLFAEATTYNRMIWRQVRNVMYRNVGTLSNIKGVDVAYFGLESFADRTIANLGNIALPDPHGKITVLDITHGTLGVWQTDPFTTATHLLSGDPALCNVVGGAGFISINYAAGAFRLTNETGVQVDFTIAKEMPTVAGYVL